MRNNKKKNKMDDLDIFSCDSSELTEAVQPKVGVQQKSKDDSWVVEAVQICRNVKTSTYNRREILDTIKIDYPKMTYERAMKIAKHKAKMLGNCYILEKCERIVEGF